jgi:hypothetical protein
VHAANAINEDAISFSGSAFPPSSSSNITHSLVPLLINGGTSYLVSVAGMGAGEVIIAVKPNVLSQAADVTVPYHGADTVSFEAAVLN